MVYPVKGLRGISVQEWDFTPSGLYLDRNWVVLKRDETDIETPKIRIVSVAKFP